ncbi:lipoyltransferase and lipoate-protein ligase [Diaporthe helianthi]|uniref:Putative lipoate-protein ligase A n=1 Tax=Diaporthe helianthi TaxID=158607 RepID=A0A2P5HZ69_DIAHE|nr:lipoyltransferase and lipoate-protein ligase [Diaporthe helianthi]
MAPLSRRIWRLKSHPRHILQCAPAGPRCLSISSSTSSSSSSSSWHAQTAEPSSRVQVYTSHSHDPYLNLSAEHFLLQNSHPESTVLFLYTNDPCIVIGRNQNPWLEVNLGLLRGFRARTGDDDGGGGNGGSNVSLVRRRSGGGAVFHDSGNVNFSVICPPAAFDRDKHAEMVVRALRGLGVATAQVNERHDIVVVAARSGGGGGGDGSPAAEEQGMQQQQQTFKISGSAYKLTRLRSLHHGTCLLGSPNLADIGRLLRSPAEPYLKARGVESVRSRICNVGVPSGDFIEAVRREFGDMYGAPDVDVELGMSGDDGVDFAHEKIQSGYRELTSREWIYNQTPLFTFSTHPSEDDPRERPPLPLDLPKDFRATITSRHGQIQEADLSGFDSVALQGQHLHNITDWRNILAQSGNSATEQVGQWFNHLFGISDTT